MVVTVFNGENPVPLGVTEFVYTDDPKVELLKQILHNPVDLLPFLSKLTDQSKSGSQKDPSAAHTEG